MIAHHSILEGRVTMLQGDVRAALATMEPNSIDCVVTSPPYWGLRDYGVDGQIGLEPTLGEHLDVMVDVFRAVRRVMKPEATLWLNYGDCYAGGGRGGNPSTSPHQKQRTNVGSLTVRNQRRVVDFLKPKDLCMIPNRLAIALQEDGWWVRSEIIWGKPNPMPDSSGRYRPSTAHEKIFMLTKSAKCFYDAEAVAVRCAQNENSNGYPGSTDVVVRRRTTTGNVRIDKQRGHGRRHHGFNDRWNAMSRAEQMANGRFLRNYEPAPLEVWPIATHPFRDAHFATFPPELARRCIKSGCSQGGVVLDPFGGSGTTAMVAVTLGRRATLIELNPDYCRISMARIEAAFMSKEGGMRHMAKLRRSADVGPLFEVMPE